MRANLDDILARNKQISSEQTKTGTLVQFPSIEEIELPVVKPLEEWVFPKECKLYMDACMDRYEVFWEKRKNLDDDLIPSLRPFYGIAEHSAFVGGKVVFGGDTSYHEHPLTDWSMLENLRCMEENENFSMLMESMEYLKEKGQQKGFFAALRGADGPMDMANAIRGNELFTDFYDEEENVHKLGDFCAKAAQWTYDHQLERVDIVNDGVMSGFGVWLPGHSVGHFSEDWSGMCSARFYEEFGVLHTQKMLEKYDCGLVHVHAMGRHVIPLIASIDKIKYVEISEDPNQISPIEVYRYYEEELKDKIVMIVLTSEEIKNNLDLISRNKNILLPKAKTIEEAKEILHVIREGTRSMTLI